MAAAASLEVFGNTTTGGHDEQDSGKGSDGTAGRVRASDAERDQMVEQPREHFEAGRLDGEEFNQRMEAAFAARFRLVSLVVRQRSSASAYRGRRSRCRATYGRQRAAAAPRRCSRKLRSAALVVAARAASYASTASASRPSRWSRSALVAWKTW